MKIFSTLYNAINNVRDGYHLNSKYWQSFKRALPRLPQHLVEVAIGMVLGDASMYKVSTHALLKFEQGYAQLAFVLHLFDLFKVYCFMMEPGLRKTLSGPRKGLPKSFWFKTFSHYSFTPIWNLFYVDGVKCILPGLVLNHVTAVSLAYWIMCDGSLNGNIMILHTQGFSKEENDILCSELNQKFGFHSSVISHKGKYWVIKLPSRDAGKLRDLISPHMIDSMRYKLPQ